MSDISWAALEPTGPQAPPPIASAFQAGQNHGFELGQKLAARHALSQVDLGDPQSVNTALQGSVRAGALEQAGALLNLNLTRMKIAGAQGALDAFGNFIGGQGAPDTPNAPAASPDPTQAQPSDNGPPPPEALSHAAETMQMATDALGRIKAANPELRHAAFAAERQRFIDRGLPTEALDAVGQHLGDQNFSDESLDDLTGHYQGHGQNFTGVAAGNTSAPPADHPSNSWALRFMNNPALQLQLGWLKSIGLDPGQIGENARALAAPELAGQTATAVIAPHVAEAGQTAAAQVGPHTAEVYLKAQIDAGYQTLEVPQRGPDGQPTGRMTTMSRAQFLAPQSEGGYGGMASALSPGEQAQATASGAAAGQAPAAIVTVKAQDGSETQMRQTRQPDGTYVLTDLHGDSAGSGGAGPVLGHGPGIGAQHTMATQAAQAAEVLKPAPDVRNQAVDTEANSLRALSIIGAHRFDQTTPIKTQIANLLRTAGIPDADHYASDMAGYRALTTQALTGGAHQAFPARTTDRDLKLMQDVFPSLTTPNDQASTAFGMQAAQAHRTQQWEDFKAAYTGDKSDPNAVYQAWLAGPGGQSIFQSPIWGRVTIGGRPAFNPATDIRTVNGKQVGAWGIGTGHPVFFAVR